MATKFRPMQYDREIDGCFNVRHRLDFSQWYDCLPGRISFSDIDAITEVAGNFLILEWKSNVGELPTGQRIMFERMTRSSPFTVICAAGEKSKPVSAQLFWKGKSQEWQTTTAADLKARIKRWSAWALKNPRFR